VFPHQWVADAIVIVDERLDMTGVGEQLRTLEQSDTGAFVRGVWKIMRTVVRLSKTTLFMHNDLHANNIVFNKAVTVHDRLRSVGRS
jgi:thiamine kinase-like enzyme